MVFYPGARFHDEVLDLFNSSVHHPSSSVEGSFFLLATFRRYTFRLTEESVSFALASCLEGSPAGFHVQFLSDRHFRFSVSCKRVGFHVYALRRFIGTSFDVYFHLWNNGVPHWEREKRLWEEEQEKEWTTILSKKQKKQLKIPPHPPKKVRFAKKLVQDSPPAKHCPVLMNTFKVGSFTISIPVEGRPTSDTPVQVDVPVQSVFDRLKSDLGVPCSSEIPCSSDIPNDQSMAAKISDLRQNNLNFEDAIQSCANCLGLGHAARNCSSPVRCKSCWHNGHRARKCFLGRRPKTSWKPKPKTQDGKQQQNPLTPAPALNSSPSSTSACPPPSTVQTSVPPGDPPSIAVAHEMANFACNPQSYLPPGAHVEHGWLHPARSRVALGGEPPRRHEEYRNITLVPEPPEHVVLEALQAVVDHLEQGFPVRILSSFRSPLGLGLVKFQSASQRQSMIDLSPIPFVNNSVIRVVKHDAARNFRACPYIRFCRVLILTFPLDYQTMEFFKAAVAPFGSLLSWHEGPNKSKSLLDCLVLTPERIPRSIVVSRGSQLGGNGESWTAPVYIIGGQFPDDFPGGEDPVPADGNPHPLHDHVLHVNPDVPQHWMHDLAGAAAEIQPGFGVQGQQMQDIMEELAANGDDNDADMGQPMDGMGNVEADEPIQEQDSITFDQSGSTAQYLRAHGPDIHLTVEMVLNGQVGSTSGSSTSSSNSSVNSVHHEDLDVAESSVIQSDHNSMVAIPTLLIVVQKHLNAVPLPISLKRTWNVAFQPPLLSSKLILPTEENYCRAIVPYQTCLHAAIMQLWAQKVDEYEKNMLTSWTLGLNMNQCRQIYSRATL